MKDTNQTILIFLHINIINILSRLFTYSITIRNLHYKKKIHPIFIFILIYMF